MCDSLLTSVQQKGPNCLPCLYQKETITIWIRPSLATLLHLVVFYRLFALKRFFTREHEKKKIHMHLIEIILACGSIIGLLPVS